MRIERGCPENAKNEVFSFKSPAAGENFGILCFEYLKEEVNPCPRHNIFSRKNVVRLDRYNFFVFQSYDLRFSGIV